LRTAAAVSGCAGRDGCGGARTSGRAARPDSARPSAVPSPYASPLPANRCLHRPSPPSPEREHASATLLLRPPAGHAAASACARLSALCALSARPGRRAPGGACALLLNDDGVLENDCGLRRRHGRDTASRTLTEGGGDGWWWERARRGRRRQGSPPRRTPQGHRSGGRVAQAARSQQQRQPAPASSRQPARATAAQPVPPLPLRENADKMRHAARTLLACRRARRAAPGTAAALLAEVRPARRRARERCCGELPHGCRAAFAPSTSWRAAPAQQRRSGYCARHGASTHTARPAVLPQRKTAWVNDAPAAQTSAAPGGGGGARWRALLRTRIGPRSAGEARRREGRPRRWPPPRAPRSRCRPACSVCCALPPPPPALFASPRRAPCRHLLRLTLRSRLPPHPHHTTPRPQPPWLVAPPAHASSHRMHTAYAAASARRALCRVAAAARDRRSFSAARCVAPGSAVRAQHRIAPRSPPRRLCALVRLRGAPHATAGGAVMAAMTGGLAKRGAYARCCRLYRSLLRDASQSAIRHVAVPLCTPPRRRRLAWSHA
jgi:hypothetical protein